jgi:hypothetical protein
MARASLPSAVAYRERMPRSMSAAVTRLMRSRLEPAGHLGAMPVREESRLERPEPASLLRGSPRVVGRVHLVF